MSLNEQGGKHTSHKLSQMPVIKVRSSYLLPVYMSSLSSLDERGIATHPPPPFGQECSSFLMCGGGYRNRVPIFCPDDEAALSTGHQNILPWYKVLLSVKVLLLKGIAKQSDIKNETY